MDQHLHASPESLVGEQLREVFDGSPIVNALGEFTDRNLTDSQSGARSDLPALTDRILAEARISGVTAMNITLGHVLGDGDPFQITVRDVARFDALIREHADRLDKVFTAADIARIAAEGRIGAIYGTQNLLMIDRDLERLDILHDLGMRVFQLTYNQRNQVGSGSLEPEGQGLTDFGGEVVERLNGLRAIIDLSHSNRQTCLDAIGASAQPIAITHTGCRALADVPRNKSDHELRTLADGGGFVGIYLMPFLAPGRQFTLADVVAHIEHAVSVAGEGAVGIGTDGPFTPIDDVPAYLAQFAEVVRTRRAMGISAHGEEEHIVPYPVDVVASAQLHRIAEALLTRGHSVDRVRGIMGGNFARFAGRVWGE